MNERKLFARVAARTGASEEEVRTVVREFFPQAFAMAMERGGCLAVPRFATFRCRPNRSGRVAFAFRPRTPQELIRAQELRRQKLSGRQPASDGRPHAAALKLNGNSYVPWPVQPPPAAPQAGPAGKKRGFLARLFGGG
jgi:nucleoid DNA-binding protein